MNSITKRWVRGSLFFTLAVIVVAEALFLFFMVTGYTNSVREKMMAEINTLNGQLSYSASSSAQARSQQLRRVMEQFDAKDKFELMLVDFYGNVVSTSSGVLPEMAEVPADIQSVLQAGAIEVGQYIGRNENGEHVMALTVRTPYSADGIVAMRVVTSMELVYRTMRNNTLLSFAFLLVVIFATVFSGVYFIRSIVLPLQKVEATASRIAQGDFDTRVQNRKNDTLEISRLCKTINHMAYELSKSEKMKNDFISSVSHELRTPLTSIKGWTETIHTVSDPEDPIFRRGVEIISSETDRLYDMVEELLDFSRMQNGLTLEKEKLDIVAEAGEAALLSTQRAASLGVELRYEEPEYPVPVMADKNRLRQVFVNIIDNAIKYSHDGGAIYVDVGCEDGFAVVQITDEGMGISPEDLENVKVRFYKGQGAVRGSGIGLAVVDEIVKAHDGRFDIESKPGAGTKVTLCFPLATADAAEPAADTQAPEKTPAKTRRQRTKTPPAAKSADTESTQDPATIDKI